MLFIIIRTCGSAVTLLSQKAMAMRLIFLTCFSSLFSHVNLLFYWRPTCSDVKIRVWSSNFKKTLVRTQNCCSNLLVYFVVIKRQRNRTRKAKLALFNNTVPHFLGFLQYALHLCIWYRVTRSYNSGSLSLSGI